MYVDDQAMQEQELTSGGVVTPTSAYAASQAHAATRIHHLPIELLGRIFHPKKPRDRRDVERYYRDLHSLSLVCSRWRDSIQESPLLWTTISSRCSLAFQSRCLLRSGDCPLTVYFVVDSEESAERFKDLVIGVRWRMLKLDLLVDSELANVEAVLTQILEEPFPTLQDLTLTSDSDVQPNLDVFSISPTLRRLTIGLPVVLNPIRLTTLRFLCIENLEDVHGIGFLALEKVVAQSPQLEELQIIETTLHVEEHYETNPSAQDPFLCPSLEALYFEQVNLTFAEAFLSRFTVPNCTRFHFQTSDAWDSSRSIVDQLRQTISIAAGCLQRDPQIKAQMTFDDSAAYVEFTLPDMSPVFSVRWNPPSIRLLAWLSAVAAQTAHTRHFSLNMTNRTEQDTATLISGVLPLRFLTSLTLSATMNAGPVILRIAMPIQHPNGALEWLLPQLSRLRLKNGTYTPEAVLQMVRLRYGHAMETVQLRQAGFLPRAFSELVLENAPATLVQEIQAIVGPQCAVRTQ